MGLRDVITGRQVYFDTNIFIYLLEGNVEYASQINTIYTALQNREMTACSSELLFTEILPPIVKQNNAAFEIVKGFINENFFQMMPLTEDICILAGFLRSDFPMKTPDALHVATALEQNCDVFLTNDRRIKAPKEIEIAYFSDF